MSYLSNALTGKKGSIASLESQFKQLANDFLSNQDVVGLIGNWNIVWGPYVMIDPLQNPINTIYVAKSTGSDGDIYVVGIAGTNSASIIDWIFEDFTVLQTVPWGYGTTAGLSPKISLATQTGLSILRNLGTFGEGPIGSFLQKVNNKKKSTIIFAGHSLGGALAPALALSLFNPGQAAGLNLGDWNNVYVYPTAGATPGNADFSTLFSNVLKPTGLAGQPYAAWNSLIWNSLDVVPHAWQTSTLLEVPQLYTTNGWDIKVQGVLLGAAIIALVGKLADENYTQLVDHQLTGSQQTNPITSDAEWADEVYDQHVKAYPNLIGIQAAYAIMTGLQTASSSPA